MARTSSARSAGWVGRYEANNSGSLGRCCVNRLYYGDCLTILQDFPLASVDLIYLDPPFNSNRQYNSIYKDETGRPLPDQIEAFCDMWELDAERERAIRTMPVLMRKSGIDDSVAEFWRLWMRALRDTQPRLLAYLSYMAERLLIMHRILKPAGSLYLHCDPTASHYIKALLDAIFGHQNFKNEIVWKRTSGHSDAKALGRAHDTLLVYAKDRHFFVWNKQYQAYDPEYLRSHYRLKDDHGRIFRTDNLTATGLSGGGYEYEWNGVTRVWRSPIETMERLEKEGRIRYTRNGVAEFIRYLDEMPGVPLQDVWTDIPPINSQAKERLGYATQKPLKLLERIIQASSNPGDVVLDPFCGCATTLEAAHKLGRKWIGIDIAIHAIKRVARVRLSERCGLVEGQGYTVEGVPRDLEGARDLWGRDKYHFQKWAVEQVDGFVTTKQTADGGIDGRIYFTMPNASDLESMVIEVKGGRTVSIRDLRALGGVLESGEALLAGLIVLNPLGPTQARNFARFAARAGSLDVLGYEYARLQVLTMAEILDGRTFATPSVVGRHEAQPVLPGIPNA